MKGIDINVLVRYLTQDDPDQSPLATRFIRRECTTADPGFINRVVLCELVWVLETAYRYRREAIADVVDKLLRTAEFEIEDAEAAWGALRDYAEASMDFADGLIGRTNSEAGCDATVTFDVKAGWPETFRPLR